MSSPIITYTAILDDNQGLAQHGLKQRSILQREAQCQSGLFHVKVSKTNPECLLSGENYSQLRPWGCTWDQDRSREFIHRHCPGDRDNHCLPGDDFMSSKLRFCVYFNVLLFRDWNFVPRCLCTVGGRVVKIVQWLSKWTLSQSTPESLSSRALPCVVEACQSHDRVQVMQGGTLIWLTEIQICT